MSPVNLAESSLPSGRKRGVSPFAGTAIPTGPAGVIMTV